MSGPPRYFVTAAEAADLLGVTRATLYAYRSRGQLRSEPTPGRPRERRYHLDDVERLKDRKEARHDPARAAARALHWGGPVLESGVTLIHDGRLYYRGRDAVKLADTATVEDAAALLWNVGSAERRRLFDQARPLTDRQVAQVRACTRNSLAQFQITLAMGAAADVASYDLRPPAVRQTAARILRLLTTVAARDASPAPIHRALQRAWAPRCEDAAGVIRTALILCADHETNVSAFVARCAASAGASPYDVVSAAMATLKGFRHGGASERIASLVKEVSTPKSARLLVASRLRHGETLPGFGHPLYPGGDPRAARLVQLAASSGNEAAWRPFRHLLGAASHVLNDHPNLDFGLAAVSRAYGLPEPAPILIFALGRTIGWMAHAMEEYTAGRLIRPRARYVGQPPSDDPTSAETLAGSGDLA